MKGLVLQRRAANKQGRRTQRSSGFRLDRDHTMKGIHWLDDVVGLYFDDALLLVVVGGAVVRASDF